MARNESPTQAAHGAHPPMRERGKEKDETWNRLLEAAEAVFAEIGYEAATVRMICERAGVKNIGSVNYYFGGKERLYAATVRAAMDCCSHGIPFPEWPIDTPTTTRLKDFIRVMTTRLMQAPRLSAMQLVAREFTQPSEACRDVIEEYIEPIARFLRTILMELLPKAAPDRIWLIGFSIIGQCLYYRQNRKVAEILIGEENLALLHAERVADHIGNFCLAALGFSSPELVTKGKLPPSAARLRDEI